MKEIIKKIVKKYSILERYKGIIFSRKKIKESTPRKILKGKENIFNIAKSAILINCIFDIEGNDNEIEISFYNSVDVKDVAAAISQDNFEKKNEIIGLLKN
jgi:hypothetical protein